MVSCQWCQPPLCVVDIGVHISISMVTGYGHRRQVHRPPDRHSSGSDASNKGRKCALGFNKDFPYINMKVACITCGDRWMPGYCHHGMRVNMRGYTHKYDPLAGKIMCDNCCNKYLLGLYYFTDSEYEPYVTESAVECVHAESSADSTRSS